MKELIRKRGTAIEPLPIPKLLSDYIRHCEFLLGSKDIKKHTKLIIQVHEGKQRRKLCGQCDFLVYRLDVWTHAHTSIRDILDTIAHEYAHLYIFNVMRISYFKDNPLYKGADYSSRQEELIAEALAYKISSEFIRDNYEEFNRSEDKLRKFFNL